MIIKTLVENTSISKDFGNEHGLSLYLSLIHISEMQQFLAEQRGTIQVYDEQVVRKLIEKITVHDEKVTVAFKSGMEIDVKM